MGNNDYTISRISETSLLVQYHEEFSTHLSVYIARSGETINKHFSEVILNTIPSYNGLLITFQPWAAGDFAVEVETILATVPRQASSKDREIKHIPTYYDHEVAKYLDEILHDTGYSLDQLITLHTAKPFFVYMIGFCPGFGYMGKLPKQIHLPRRKTPQLKIAAGSVAIAEFQTAIYPIEMPGGWHVIGRTPLQVFDAARKEPSFFKQGDLVQFHAISKNDFLEQGGKL